MELYNFLRFIRLFGVNSILLNYGGNVTRHLQYYKVFENMRATCR